MKYSDTEAPGVQTEDALIEAGLELLPVIGRTLYAAISDLGQAYQLKPAQLKVLLYLSARGQMTVGQVASALTVSMPAASELVDRLVETGYLVRSTDPADRRRVLISPTPVSRRIGMHLRDLRRAQLHHALAQLAPEERPMFIRSLEALVAGLTHASGFDLPGWTEEFSDNLVLARSTGAKPPIDVPSRDTDD
jgi:DNA-binding MarR family transcriptional regulator